MFTQADGATTLPFWIESWNNTATSTIWVKVPSLVASSTSSIYMYFGNHAVSTSASDASSTMAFYRGFTTNSFSASTSETTTYDQFESLLPPTRYTGNPIIAHGGGGWKDSQVQEPVVMQDPNDSTKLIMFYAAMAAPISSGVMSIGRATASVSNPHAWTEYSGNPIVSPSSGTGGTPTFDTLYDRLDSVVYYNGTYYMYFTGNDGTNDSIGLATSSNGFTFTKYPTAVLTP